MNKEAGFRSVTSPTKFQLRPLLQNKEREVPARVLCVCDFLNRHGVWFRISRNHKAKSCRDAARKRRVKKEGATEAGLNRLRDILSTEVDSTYVVLALTELSLLLAHQRRKSRSGKVLVDPLELYAEALACRFLSLPFPQAY